MPSEGRRTVPRRDQIVQHRLRGIDGNGEADARALVRAAGGDHAINADHLAMRIQQRPAGIAGVDGGIGLDGFFNVGAFADCGSAAAS